MSFTLLACGGRAFTDGDFVFHVLDTIHAKRPITLLIEGGAFRQMPDGKILGADYFSRQWAISRNVPYQTERAEWKKYGNAAGPIRNAAMLSKWSPDGCVAFPGNRGTADMIRQAEAAGIKVFQPTYEPATIPK